MPIFFTILLLFFTSSNLFALTCNRAPKTFTVKMLDISTHDATQRMVFEPAVVHICQGDSVEWIEGDSGHNSRSLIIPENAKHWSGYIGDSITVKFSTPGTYLYECSPHVHVGMIGMVVVDTPSNHETLKPKLEAFVRKYPSASKRLSMYLKHAHTPQD